jgi:hypothetical protein
MIFWQSAHRFAPFCKTLCLFGLENVVFNDFDIKTAVKIEIFKNVIRKNFKKPQIFLYKNEDHKISTHFCSKIHKLFQKLTFKTSKLVLCIRIDHSITSCANTAPQTANRQSHRVHIFFPLQSISFDAITKNYSLFIVLGTGKNH